MSKGLLERIEEKLDYVITLLSSATEVAGEPVVVKNNTPFEPISAPSTTAETPVADVSDPYAGVDAEGVPWDKRIHSKAKDPKAATGARKGCWKRRKGISDELYDQVMAELKASEPSSDVGQPPFFFRSGEITGRLDTVDELAALQTNDPAAVLISEEEFRKLKPTTPAVPSAPGAPSVPSAPSAPGAPGVNPDKKECIDLIRKLTDFDVDNTDINSIMTETTGFDTMDKVPADKFAELKLALNTWHGWLVCCKNAIDAMVEIAEPLNFTDNLNQGLAGLFEQYTAENFESVHYSQIAELSGKLDEYLVSWREL